MENDIQHMLYERPSGAVVIGEPASMAVLGENSPGMTESDPSSSSSQGRSFGTKRAARTRARPYGPAGAAPIDGSASAPAPQATISGLVQFASGSGRIWNLTMPGLAPTPPSMCQVTAAP